MKFVTPQHNLNLRTNIGYVNIVASNSAPAAFLINGIIPDATNQVTQRSREPPTLLSILSA